MIGVVVTASVIGSRSGHETLLIKSRARRGGTELHRHLYARSVQKKKGPLRAPEDGRCQPLATAGKNCALPQYPRQACKSLTFVDSKEDIIFDRRNRRP